MNQTYNLKSVFDFKATRCIGIKISEILLTRAETILYRIIFILTGKIIMLKHKTYNQFLK